MPHRTGLLFRRFDRSFSELLELAECALHPESKKRLSRALQLSLEPEATGDAVFLHSLSGALVDQLEQQLVGAPYDDLFMIAPFHDLAHQATRKLSRLVGADKIRVAADAGEPPGPEKSVDMGVLTDSRSLHAKVMHARGDGATFLVVGSANLTSAAWEEGRNIEAISVRQSLQPDTFNEWIGSVEFRHEDWSGAPRVDQRRDHEKQLSSVPLGWASLVGDTLQAGAPKLESAQFTLESGSERSAVGLSYMGAGIWEGPSPLVPTQSAVLRVQASGHLEAAVVVEQQELLGSVGNLRRLRGLLRRVDAGLIEFEDRRELLAALGDVFAAYQRADTISGARRGGAAPTADSGKNGLEPKGEVEEVESLLTAFGRGSAENRIDRLLDLVRTMLDRAKEPTRTSWICRTLMPHPTKETGISSIG